MKEYVCLIGIYAVNMIYILGYVFPVISFSIGGIDDFFIVNYTLFCYGIWGVRLIVYVLLGALAVRFGREPKQTKRELMIDLLVIDFPAIAGVTYYFWWGNVYNWLLESPLWNSFWGSWVYTILFHDLFREMTLIIGSLMLGIEIARYIDYFKHKSSLN